MGKSEAWANRIALAKMYFDRGDIKSKPANGGLRRQCTQYRIISNNRGTCKTASAAGIFKISGDFRMSATRRRSVSDMLILLGTTSGKLGIADDVATG